MTASATTVAAGTGGQVSYSSVPVRSGPAYTYASVGTAHAGEIYVVIEWTHTGVGYWYQTGTRWTRYRTQMFARNPF